MENISATTSTDPARAGFTEWLNSEAGSILARREREKIGRILSGLFGYHITQIGHYDAGLLDSAGRIRNKIELHLDDDGLQDCECGVLSSVASLPFAAHSIDVVVIPHVLEYTSDPGAALKEIERVLIEDGRLIVTGFNPWSLWGLWRLIPERHNRPPWNGCFHGTARLKHWLSMLDFELLEVERFSIRPPRTGKGLLSRLLFLEKPGKFWLPLFGAAYIIVAQKRRIPATPIKMNWRKKIFLPGASAGPATNMSGVNLQSTSCTLPLRGQRRCAPLFKSVPYRLVDGCKPPGG